MEKINFEEGRLRFLIPEGAINYGDNKFVYLINYNSEEGFFKIVKDKDNGIKVLYNYFKAGVCNLKTDAEELDNNKKHEIIVTWSMSYRKMKLYIDSEEKASSNIEINVPLNPQTTV